MILAGLFVALVCSCLSALLAIRALRELWRTSGWILARTPWGERSHRAVIEADDELVTAPFSGRPALWVRARVIGPPAEGGAPRELWRKELFANASVATRRGRARVSWAEAKVVVRTEYRRGTEKVLERESPVLSRVLSRSGYRERPKGSTFFELEEEVLLADSTVLVRGAVVDGALVAPGEGESVIVSTLDPVRLVARQSWGALLALWFAALASLSGGGVLVAAWWLRRGT
ncbi:MAG: hypothetical protein JNK05_29665 [Myxococcales bacterium]|nr:hypothetical protein [Myxococcales bacterium]